MGLNIRFAQRKKNCCPHCGEFVNHTEVEMISSSGRCWYPFLESIGYYVPNAERDEWYGKDMELTEEQARKLYAFAAEHDLYNGDEVKRLIAVALFEKDVIVINADW